MRLVRIKDVATRYRMSPATFYRWRCFGTYPQLFAKIGNTLFVDESELLRMARQSRNEAQSKDESVRSLVHEIVDGYKKCEGKAD